MNSGFATFQLLVQIAMRNLVASRLKTFIIGGIIFVGTVMVVVGGSLLDSVETSMARSVVGSVAGHLQIYSSKSKDELAIFGSMGGGDADLAAIDDFAKIRTALETLPNVDKVVPMGISGAIVTSGNTIDLTLASLREAITKSQAGETSPELTEQLTSLKQHVQAQAKVVASDLNNLEVLASSDLIPPESRELVTQASTDTYWQEFDQDPLNKLESLENRMAPLATDADVVFLRYVGTDMDSFANSFDRLEIVDGIAVPKGQRGFLFAKFFYEDRLKLKTARRLDKIEEALKDSGRKIATDQELQRYVKSNVDQIREIVLQMDPIRTRKAVEKLQALLKSTDTNISALLASYFEMNDGNFAERYAFFYRELAPLVQLYRIKVGDTLTIKAVTRTGFIQSVNVKVYGTFQFKGLEKSALAGALNLMDLMSFRDLYGYLTSEKAAEFAKMKESVGAKDVNRENAEAELFGGGNTVVADAQNGMVELSQELDGNAGALRQEDITRRIYSQEEIEQGVVLNAAVMLKDPALLEQTKADIEALSAKEGLGLSVVSWQKAAGLLGQFAVLLRLVLVIAVFIIFVVALVVINNAMMMATLERVREIGTLRAIGAQRGFVMQMLLVETIVVGIVFGTAGAAAGTGIVMAIQKAGIPAVNDFMYFLFSGPRLRPDIGSANLVAAFFIVLLVSGFSSFYPAFLATRVSPLQAMQSDE